MPTLSLAICGKTRRMKYELYYWPGIQGRGEFVRLTFEDAGAEYVDVARLTRKEGGGVEKLMRLMRGDGALRPFAPPFVKVGDFIVAQTANILHYLAPRLGLAPKDEQQRVYAHQLQLTIADMVVEAHDTHHPIAVGLYYEDQRKEAKARAAHFIEDRLSLFLGYFEDVLERSGGKHFLRSHSYVDLSMFQLLSGLDYAFPNAMARARPKLARLSALQERVAKRPRIAAYLASDRRIPFNESGIFRHYPELDAKPRVGRRG
jgi:glutathione S-transferase